MSDHSKLVTRFAPSPTGDLHVGGARTALFCWALARKTGGSFLLRIEDTDAARSSAESERAILKDLAWLGIDWDEGPEFEADGRSLGGDPRGVGPFRQSERRDIYDAYFEKLIDSGFAYPAFDTPDELAALRTMAEKEKRTFLYRQPEDYAAEAAAARAASESHVIRLKVPHEAITVHDEVLGEVTFGPGEIEDFVIRKADGMPTYHFACVIDDELMGVNMVVRGQEHLMNTPKHVALQKALAACCDDRPFETPRYAHIPLIFNEQGAKMSKRERDKAAREAIKQGGIKSSPATEVDEETFSKWLKDSKSQLPPEQVQAIAEAIGLTLPEVSVKDFEAAGYLPETLNNFLALLGYTPSRQDDGSERERFGMDFLAGDFSLDRVGRSNARFDRNKLLAFSTDTITTMEPAEFRKAFEKWAAAHAPEVIEGTTDAQRKVLLPAVQAQSKTLRDAAERCGFVLLDAGSIEHDEKAVKKWLLKNEGQGLDTLRVLREVLHTQDDWSASALQARAESLAAEEEHGGLGVGMGGIAQPLRVALTGTAVSPPIAQTLAALGKDETLVRIDCCLARVDAPAAS